MESSWKILFVSCIIWYVADGGTTTIDLLHPRVMRNAGYLPPISNLNKNADTSAASTKSYTTKPTRNIEDFNTRPQIKEITKSSFTSTNSRPLFTSYVPPPSGVVSYKNVQLPLSSDAVKIPIVLTKNEYTKHPGFIASSISEHDNKASSSQMLMIEETPSLILQPQHNKTIEAAKILASTLLEATGESPLESGNVGGNLHSNSTDVYIVKSQKKAYIIPTHLKKDISKSSSVEDLYPMRDQFEKAYTINQFIFVIKPERINFLNKLV